jgi:hypothetical protein
VLFQCPVKDEGWLHLEADRPYSRRVSIAQQRKTPSMDQEKDTTFAFLRKLEHGLVDKLPAADRADAEIRRIVAEAKKDADQKHKSGPEYAFINHYVIPTVSELLCAEPGFSADRAKDTLLSEFFRYTGDVASASPARRVRHPFNKEALGLGTAGIMNRWKGLKQKNALTQSCPDFALTAPYKTVFEAKYFSAGSTAAAERTLVQCIFEAFLYLALPKLAATKTHPAWNYEHSCLVAYDASRHGTLQKAWTALPRTVRRGFWDGGNLYVMIVRGTSTSAGPPPA